MTLEDKIRDIIANYWLNENKYCGLSSFHIYQKLQDENKTVTEEEIKILLRKMEKAGEISTRKIKGSDRTFFRFNGSKFVEVVQLGPYEDFGFIQKKNCLKK